jgi:hypothetical protein
MPNSPSRIATRRGPLRRPARWPSPVRPVLDPSPPTPRRPSSPPPARGILSSPLAAAIRRFRPASRTTTAEPRTGASRGSWEAFSGEGASSDSFRGGFGSSGSGSGSGSRSRSRTHSRSSTTPELAYEHAVARAAMVPLLGLEGAGPAVVADHQAQLARLDAERAALPVDVRTRPDWRAPAGARLEGFDVLGTAPRLTLYAFWKALARGAAGRDLHPACVRLAVVSAGLDPEGALERAAAATGKRARTFLSERRAVSGERGLPLTGRRHEVSVVHADPRLPGVVGGPGDRYVPDRRLRAWLAAATRRGYVPEHNPRRRRRVRGKPRRYLFRVVEGSDERLWDPVMARMHADRSLPVGRARRWGRIFPALLRIDDQASGPAQEFAAALRALVRRLADEAAAAAGGSRGGGRSSPASGSAAGALPFAVGLAMVSVGGAAGGLRNHVLAFIARLVPARPAFYGHHGLRLKLMLLNPTARSSLPSADSVRRLRRAAEAAARAEGLMAPREARPVDIRRGALGPVLVDRLGPAVEVGACRRVAVRQAVQPRGEPSCGPSSFALMLAAARLGPAAAKDCGRVYSAVGDEDVVIAAQMYRQA